MRIVAFGCSYTYGQGLIDCHLDNNTPGLKHSEFSWPSILAKKLNCDCINLSHPGYGNGAILNSILNFEFLQDDIICVMWSFKNRDILFTYDGKNKNLGRWIKPWFIQQDLFDLSIKNYLHIHHAESYLKSNKIKYYFMDPDFYQDLGTLKPQWFKSISFVDIDFKTLEKSLPLALDNLHPGANFHLEVAEILKKDIAGC